MNLNVIRKATSLLAMLLTGSFIACQAQSKSAPKNDLASQKLPRIERIQLLTARVISSSSVLQSLLISFPQHSSPAEISNSFYLNANSSLDQVLGATSHSTILPLRVQARTRQGEIIECNSIVGEENKNSQTKIPMKISCSGAKINILISSQIASPERIANSLMIKALEAGASLTLSSGNENAELTLQTNDLILHKDRILHRIKISEQQKTDFISNKQNLTFNIQNQTCQAQPCNHSSDFFELTHGVNGELILSQGSVSANNRKTFIFNPTRAFKVSSYNIENFWDDEPHNSDAYEDYSQSSSNWHSDKLAFKKAARIRTALLSAGLPDVVGMQEIESAGNKSRTLEILKPVLSDLGYSYYALGRQNEENPTAVTTAMISKYPIIENSRLDFIFTADELPEAEQKDFSGASRDPQRVTVALPEGTVFSILNSHWKSKRDKSPVGDVMRKRIASLMRSHVEELSNADGTPAAAIIMGDFNADYREAPVQEGLELSPSLAQARQNNNPKALVPLWLTLPASLQGDYPHDSHLQALDNIIVTASLLKAGPLSLAAPLQIIGREGYGAEILSNGDGLPFRSQLRKFKDNSGNMKTTHFDLGFSDHLPIVAQFRRVLQGETIPAEIRFDPSIETQTIAQLPLVEISGAPCSEKDNTKTGTAALETARRGECILLDSMSLPLQQTGLYNIFFQLSESQSKTDTPDSTPTKILISADRTFGENKNWLRGTLQNSAGKTLKRILGRMGVVEGHKALFIHAPQSDILIQ